MGRRRRKKAGRVFERWPSETTRGFPSLEISKCGLEDCRLAGIDSHSLDGFMSAYLVVGDGRLSVVGELHQRAQVGAQV